MSGIIPVRFEVGVDLYIIRFNSWLFDPTSIRFVIADHELGYAGHTRCERDDLSMCPPGCSEEELVFQETTFEVWGTWVLNPQTKISYVDIKP